MPIIFSDEDLMYIGKEQDNQLRSIRLEIATLKAKSEGNRMISGRAPRMNHHDSRLY